MVGVRIAGRMEIAGPAGALGSRGLGGRQGRLVLASLALAGRPVHREVLADRLWGDRRPGAWSRDLSAVVSRLRAAMASVGYAADTITSAGASYRLDLPDEAIDILAARRAVVEAERALRDDDPVSAAALGRQAALTAGLPVLPDEDAGWLDAVRTELAALRLRALETVAVADLALGRPVDAIAAAQEVIDADPYRESAHRALLPALVAAGNRAEAVRAHERLRSALRDDLGLDPAPETQAVYLDVLRDVRGPAPSAPAGDRAAARTWEAGPLVHYARSGRVSVAYQVVGSGPVDLVLVPGWVSNLEMSWQEPHLSTWLRRIAGFSRLLLFDKRGTGLSDPIPVDNPPALEERMDDVRAVMDDAESERAVILGFSEGGTLAVTFAAAHPQRVAGLVLWGAWSRQTRGPDWPYGWSKDEGRRRLVGPLQRTGTVSPRWFAPTLAGDPDFDAWFARYARLSASPGMAIALLRANAAMDVRGILQHVHVPTLVLHQIGDTLVDVAQGRYLAEHIPGARLIELPGRDHWPWATQTDYGLDEIERFVADCAGSRPAGRRVLMSLVAIASDPGDDIGRARLREVARSHQGHVGTAGDGSELLCFDGPRRAVRCAAELVSREVSPSAGVHVGEVDAGSERMVDAAVPLTQWLAAQAQPGEVLLSRAVTDLVAGSGLSFDIRPGISLPDQSSQPVYALQFTSGGSGQVG